MIPRENIWIPLTIKIIQTSEGQPLVGSSKINVFTIITKIIKNEIKQNNNPIADEIRSGAVEKAVIPSKAYFVSFQKDHYVFPATLWIFLYSIHFTSKPTKLNKPFEYLLYSFKESIASTTCLFINT